MKNWTVPFVRSFVLYLILFSSVFAKSGEVSTFKTETFKWSFLYAVQEPGSLTSVMVYDPEISDAHGFFLIWKDPCLENEVYLFDVSRFDYVIRRFVGIGELTTKDNFASRILPQIVYRFVVAPNEMVIDQERLQEIVTSIEKRPDIDGAAEVVAQIEASSARFDDKTWEFKVTVLTRALAIESRTVSGTFDPLSVREVSHRVIAPVGFVPKSEAPE